MFNQSFRLAVFAIFAALIFGFSACAAPEPIDILPVAALPQPVQYDLKGLVLSAQGDTVTVQPDTRDAGAAERAETLTQALEAHPDVAARIAELTEDGEELLAFSIMQVDYMDVNGQVQLLPASRSDGESGTDIDGNLELVTYLLDNGDGPTGLAEAIWSNAESRAWDLVDAIGLAWNDADFYPMTSKATVWFEDGSQRKGSLTDFSITGCAALWEFRTATKEGYPMTSAQGRMELEAPSGGGRICFTSQYCIANEVVGGSYEITGGAANGKPIAQMQFAGHPVSDVQPVLSWLVYDYE